VAVFLLRSISQSIILQDKNNTWYDPDKIYEALASCRDYYHHHTCIIITIYPTTV